MKPSQFKLYIISLLILIFMSGCALKSVRQQDLNSWKGVSVEELDTHSLFLTLPVIKTKTESGIEIRVYPNKVNVSSCYENGNINNNGYLNYSQFNIYQNCSNQLVGCDNIFYIKDKKIVEYKPVGSCYTDETVQPEKRNWN
jgi:hypothetical protein